MKSFVVRSAINSLFGFSILLAFLSIVLFGGLHLGVYYINNYQDDLKMQLQKYIPVDLQYDRFELELHYLLPVLSLQGVNAQVQVDTIDTPVIFKSQDFKIHIDIQQSIQRMTPVFHNMSMQNVIIESNIDFNDTSLEGEVDYNIILEKAMLVLMIGRTAVIENVTIKNTQTTTDFELHIPKLSIGSTADRVDGRFTILDDKGLTNDIQFFLNKNEDDYTFIAQVDSQFSQYQEWFMDAIGLHSISGDMGISMSYSSKDKEIRISAQTEFLEFVVNDAAININGEFDVLAINEHIQASISPFSITLADKTWQDASAYISTKDADIDVFINNFNLSIVKNFVANMHKASPKPIYKKLLDWLPQGHVQTAMLSGNKDIGVNGLLSYTNISIDNADVLSFESKKGAILFDGYQAQLIPLDKKLTLDIPNVYSEPLYFEKSEAKILFQLEQLFAPIAYENQDFGLVIDGSFSLFDIDLHLDGALYTYTDGDMQIEGILCTNEMNYVQIQRIMKNFPIDNSAQVWLDMIKKVQMAGCIDIVYADYAIDEVLQYAVQVNVSDGKLNVDPKKLSGSTDEQTVKAHIPIQIHNAVLQVSPQQIAIQKADLDIEQLSIDSIDLIYDLSEDVAKISGEIIGATQDIYDGVDNFLYDLPEGYSVTEGKINAKIEADFTVLDFALNSYTMEVDFEDVNFSRIDYDIPVINNFHGTVLLSEKAVSSESGLRFNLFEQPFTIDIAKHHQAVDVKIKGTLDQHLFRFFDWEIASQVINGHSTFELDLITNTKFDSLKYVEIHSNLLGLNFDAGGLLSKQADEEVALQIRLEHGQIYEDGFTVIFDLSDMLAADGMIDSDGGLHGNVYIGKYAINTLKTKYDETSLVRDKLHVYSSIDPLDIGALIDWFQLHIGQYLNEDTAKEVPKETTQSVGNTVVQTNGIIDNTTNIPKVSMVDIDTRASLSGIKEYIRSFHITSSKLGYKSLQFSDVSLDIFFDENQIRSNIVSDELDGEIQWPYTKEQHAILDFEKVYLDFSDKEQNDTQSGEETSDTAEAKIDVTTDNVNDEKADALQSIYPQVIGNTKLHIEDLQINGDKYGTWDIITDINEQGVVLRTLDVRYEKLLLKGNGTWTYIDGEHATEIFSNLTGKDIKLVGGAFTSEKGQVHLHAYWPGSPALFRPLSIGAAISIDFIKGSYASEDLQGVAVLNLLSLIDINSLLRRLRLDFSDQGKQITFEELRANFKLEQGGVLHSVEPYFWDGSSIKIEGEGILDMKKNMLDHEIKVTAQIGGSLPLAALVAGSGPVAGLFVLFNTLDDNPLNDLASIKYRIHGDLQDLQFDAIKQK